MSFIRDFISKNITKKTQAQKKTSMILLQSNTLGMTVVQQNDESNVRSLQLTEEEWINILAQGKLDGVPYNNIYFSFLKGLPNFLRMKIWLLLCTENGSKKYVFSGQSEKRMSQQFKQIKQQHEKSQQINPQNNNLFSVFTIDLFKKLITSKPQPKQSQQIQKDIKRTYSNKMKFKYTEPLLRKILYALSNSGVQYTQGMNYILLYVIIFCLESLGVNQETFQSVCIEKERDIFIILREIVIRLDEVFDNQNIFKVLKQLQQKISQTVPDVFFLIYKLGMDTYSLFAQNYYSLLTYSDPPDELTKQMIDLFFLQGDKAITSLIVRMLQIAHDQIMRIKSPQKLQQFIKIDLFHYCFKTLCEQKVMAKTINDFGISFYQNVQKC